MRIMLNGRPQELPEGSTIAAAVAELGYGNRQVVAELNGEPVERERFSDVALAPGDVLEIVRAVAGGSK